MARTYYDQHQNGRASNEATSMPALGVLCKPCEKRDTSITTQSFKTYQLKLHSDMIPQTQAPVNRQPHTVNLDERRLVLVYLVSVATRPRRISGRLESIQPTCTGWRNNGSAAAAADHSGCRRRARRVADADRRRSDRILRPHGRPLVNMWPPAGPFAKNVARRLNVECPDLTQSCTDGVVHAKLLM
jgi:hypothetical protein